MNWFYILPFLKDFLSGVRSKRYNTTVLLILAFVVLNFWCEFKYDASSDVEACSARQVVFLGRVEELLK